MRRDLWPLICKDSVSREDLNTKAAKGSPDRENKPRSRWGRPIGESLTGSQRPQSPSHAQPRRASKYVFREYIQPRLALPGYYGSRTWGCDLRCREGLAGLGIRGQPPGDQCV